MLNELKKLKAKQLANKPEALVYCVKLQRSIYLSDLDLEQCYRCKQFMNICDPL